jgi:hypothetical protein
MYTEYIQGISVEITKCLQRKRVERIILGLLNFWTLPIVRYCEKLENTAFLKLDLFPSSGKWETATALGPSERADLNYYVSYNCFPGKT